MRPPFRAGDRMHLIHDHGIHRFQDAARFRSEHEIQRLRGRDQNVRRMRHDRTSLLRGRISTSGGDGDLRRMRAKGIDLFANTGQRDIKVLRHVDAKRLQR